MNQTPAELSDLTEDQIARQLSGEAYKGPRSWRGRPLAPYTLGLRELAEKVIAPTDPLRTHDLIFLSILADAHADTAEQKLEKRTALILATDGANTFRTRASLLLDDLSEADITEARKLVNEIISPVKAAEVKVVAEKKSGEPAQAVKRSRTRKS